MAEHFKLEISPRGVKITSFTGVSENFAKEYQNILQSNDSGWEGSDVESSVDVELTDAMKTVFDVDMNNTTNKPIPTPKKKKKTKEGNQFPEDSFQSKYAKYNYSKRVKKRAQEFKNLAYLNFNVPNAKFVTLTFDERVFNDCTDREKCHAEFRKFIKRIQSKFTNFKYIAVFSRQKNMHWHYHMLCNFDESVLNKEIQSIWKNGMVHSTSVYSVSELGTKISYCVDNMSRYAIDNWNNSFENLMGVKGYLRSNDLMKRIVLRSWNENECSDAYRILGDIVGGVGIDKPIANYSKILERGKVWHEGIDGVEYHEEDKVLTVTVSNKGFAELFELPEAAKRIADISNIDE